MSAILLAGKPCADAIYAKISQRVAGATLFTLGFDEPKWTQYTSSLTKSAQKIGVNCQNRTVSDDVLPQEFCELVDTAAKDSRIDGILIQQPLPREFRAAYRFADVNKDLDCCNPLSVASMYEGQAKVCPATPSAVKELLDHYGVGLSGKHVVIVGRGNAVGKPLIHIMLSADATVTVCHTKTVNLPAVCRTADILVSACGVPDLITDEFVTDKTVVVDVGLSFVNGKTHGDVSSDAYEKCRAISPVPGGVGPVTRAVLFENLYKLAK